jgi:hypothetical protein
MRLAFSLGRFVARLFPWRDGRLVEQLAGEVARQCQGGLWRRVCRRAADMSTAEVRGYARAHAASYVMAETEHVFRSRRIRPALQGEVADAAVDQLVGMIARDAFRSESTASARPMAA